VEAAQLFGDRLHLRVAPDAADAVIHRLPEAAKAAAIEVESIRLVPSQLEDVFIHLLEGEAAETG
jgi:hypothetical protein